MFHEGQKLSEYTLIKKLGSGGFGEVWLAEFKDEKFAVKLPHKDQVDWKSITQEIGLWTLCGKHANVMPLIGARNFSGQIAIISEYAPDGSLEDLLKEKGKLSVTEAVEMTIGILEGLQHLHESGIIHRDLKPANILLDGNKPRLTDFGISRIINGDSLSETISGTWAYMAPECFDGKRNIQTDIWSVGVILYRMLTGNLPFPQKEITALIGSLVNDEFNEINKLKRMLNYYHFSPNNPKFNNEVYDIAKSYLMDGYGFVNQYLDFQTKVEDLIEYFYKEFAFSEDDLYKIKPYIEKIVEEFKNKDENFQEQVQKAREHIYKHLRKDLFNLISTSIEKDLVKRYKTAEEMKDSFQAWYDNEFYSFWGQMRNKRRWVYELNTRNDEVEVSQKPISNDLLIPYRKRDKWGFCTSDKQTVIEPKYEKVYKFSGNLALAVYEGKRGFIDKKGKTVIPFNYDRALDFNKGIAPVSVDGKVGFINRTGDLITSLKYNSFVRYSGDLAVVKINNKYGLVNEYGKEVVTPIYDSIDEFHEGLASTKINRKHGFIDVNGNEIIKPIYEYDSQFSEGLAPVCVIVC